MDNTGLQVLISGTGKSQIGQAIANELTTYCQVYFDIDELEDSKNVIPDIAICVSGDMHVGPPEDVTQDVLRRMTERIYMYPRMFIEDCISRMQEYNINGLVIIIGSIAAKYGNVYAEDYAALKAALGKYIELRGRTVRESGIALTLLNLGAVNTQFWDGIDTQYADKIKPSDMSTALSPEDVASLVASIIDLPAGLVIKDATVVGTRFQ